MNLSNKTNKPFINKLYKNKDIKYILFNLFIIYLLALNISLSYKTKFIWILGYESSLYKYITVRPSLALSFNILYLATNIILIMQLKKVIDRFYQNINKSNNFTYIIISIYSYLQVFIHIALLSRIAHYIFPQNLIIATFIWASVFSPINIIFSRIRIMAEEVYRKE